MRRTLFPAAFVILASLVGCASSPTVITSREDGLLKSGFQKISAETPERQTMMKNLTPYEVSQIPNGGGSLYVYSDPKVCQCIYVGSPVVWSRYQQQRMGEHIADRQIKADSLPLKANWVWEAWGIAAPKVSSSGQPG